MIQIWSNTYTYIHAHNSEMEKYALENQQPLFHFYVLRHQNPLYILFQYAVIIHLGKFDFFKIMTY